MSQRKNGRFRTKWNENYIRTLTSIYHRVTNIKARDINFNVGLPLGKPPAVRSRTSIYRMEVLKARKCQKDFKGLVQKSICVIFYLLDGMGFTFLDNGKLMYIIQDYVPIQAFNVGDGLRYVVGGRTLGISFSCLKIVVKHDIIYVLLLCIFNFI